MIYVKIDSKVYIPTYVLRAWSDYGVGPRDIAPLFGNWHQVIASLIDRSPHRLSLFLVPIHNIQPHPTCTTSPPRFCTGKLERQLQPHDETYLSHSHQWSHVVIGMWHKYPNPHCAHVLTVDTVDRSVDPKTGIIRTERILGCKQKMPGWIIKVRLYYISSSNLISNLHY